MDERTDNSERHFTVTNKMVLRIAVPMTLAYLTTPLIGIADTAIVGQLGDAALLGGLAAGAIVFDVVFATFNFLRSGTTGLVSQAYGSRDRAEEQAIFWRALILALLIGTALLLLGPLIAAFGAWFIAGEPRVTEALQTYVLIRLWCAPLALGNYAILGYVLGRGEGGVGLALQFAINLTNIALSIWLGLHLGWGLEGVAWGTVLGEAIGFAIGIAVLTTRFGRRGPMPGERGWRNPSQRRR